MFENGGSGVPASLGAHQPLEDERGRVHDHLDNHGPLPTADLQGDLYPHDPRRFRHVLAVLCREGVLEVAGRAVEAGVDPATLGEAERTSLGGSTLTLRPARGADFETLLDLVGSVAGEARQSGLDSVAGDIVADRRIHRWDGKLGRAVYVAAVDGRVCGWAHLAAVPGAAWEQAELTGGVAERFRGEWVGSHLLQYALDSPLTRKHCRVYQHIPAGDDDAFQFLRMHGWHVEARGSDADRLRVVQDV